MGPVLGFQMGPCYLFASWIGRIRLGWVGPRWLGWTTLEDEIVLSWKNSGNKRNFVGKSKWEIALPMKMDPQRGNIKWYMN